ncbi:SREBP regulating protein [Saguinus oedipus]|uniref:SREBP regulating gene protein n=1 Tax=Saguinus oedipus TaxID=9490 RepID=A0ABQ9TGF5_SAGOE|nr:SREBP regulating protein [Saguinus oedipus]
MWRRLPRKRWVLALIFGLLLVYFLSSTSKQEERAMRDRNPLLVQDRDQPIQWKVQFNLGNSSRLGNQRRNSIQGKLLSALPPHGWAPLRFKQLLEHFLNWAAVAFHNLFMAVEDHLELCLAKCRISSQSVQHENTYRDPIAKYCYEESLPELFPA